ncbi:hypothetical protein SDJN02_06972, partial [Cucurbita argyrosperma subsp. argyrosperma]
MTMVAAWEQRYWAGSERWYTKQQALLRGFDEQQQHPDFSTF